VASIVAAPECDRPRADPAAALVKGVDLLAMGLKEGPRVGEILKKLYDAQLNEELKVRRAALAAARRMIEGA